MGELLFNGALLLFFIAMAFVALGIEGVEYGIPAKLWPLILLSLIIVLLLIKIVKLIKTTPKEQMDIKPVIMVFKRKETMLLLLSIAWLAIYLVLMNYLGFFFSTIVFCMGLSFIFGLRKPVNMLLIGAAITCVVFVIFVWGLGVHPPRGVGFIESFSKWLEYLV